MNYTTILEKLSPVTQALIALGAIVLLLLAARDQEFSRNLTAFLRNLRYLASSNRSYPHFQSGTWQKQQTHPHTPGTGKSE